MSSEEQDLNSGGSGNVPEESREPETEGREETEEYFSQADPDVILDVPKLQVDELNLEVQDVRARVALRTRLSELLEIEVGLDVSLDTVKLETKGVDAEAQLKARLDNVHSMIERTLSSVDENPEIIKDLTEMTESSSRSSQNSEEVRRNVLGADRESGGSERDSKPQATEAAEKKARELGLDVTSLEGTGSGGRVILRDVRRAARGD